MSTSRKTKQKTNPNFFSYLAISVWAYSLMKSDMPVQSLYSWRMAISRRHQKWTLNLSIGLHHRQITGKPGKFSDGTRYGARYSFFHCIWIKKINTRISGFILKKKKIFQLPSSSSFFLDSTSFTISKITLQLITQFNIHKEGDDIY